MAPAVPFINKGERPSKGHGAAIQPSPARAFAEGLAVAHEGGSDVRSTGQSARWVSGSQDNPCGNVTTDNKIA